MKKWYSIILTCWILVWGVFVFFQYLNFQMDPYNLGFMEYAFSGETEEEESLYHSDTREWLERLNNHTLIYSSHFFNQRVLNIMNERERTTGNVMTNAEIEPLPDYQSLMVLRDAQTLVESLLMQEPFSEDFDKGTLREAIIPEIKNYGTLQLKESFNLYVNSWDVVDGFLIFIIILYLFAAFIYYLLEEKTSVKLAWPPYLYVLSFLAFLYVFYNVSFVENIIPHMENFQKEDFFFIQWTFIKYIFMVSVTYIVITLLTVSCGRYILQKFHKTPTSLLSSFLSSHIIGLAAFVIFLFVLGVFHLLLWYVLLVLFGVLFYLFRKEVWYFIRLFFTHKLHVEWKCFSLHTFLILFIAVFLCLDILSIMRPVPIGWDSINTYQNTVKLIGNYGYLISDLNFFNWEIVMSLGHVFWNSTMVALFLSFYPLIFVFLTMGLFFRTYFTKQGGVIAAALFLSLPMVQHFSSSDMKIENALLYFGIMAVFFFFQYWFSSKPAHEEGEEVEDESYVKLLEMKHESKGWQMAIVSIFVYFFVQFNTSLPFSFLPDFLDMSFAGMVRILSFLFMIFMVIAGIKDVFTKKESKEHEKELLPSPNYFWLYVCGLLLGVSVGIKLTAIFTVFALLCLLAYRVWNIWGAISIFFLQIAFYSLTNQVVYYSNIIEDPSIQTWGLITLLILGVIFFVLSFVFSKKTFVVGGKHIGLFLICIALPILPWFAKNAFEIGWYNPEPQWSVQSLLTGYNANAPRYDVEALDIDRSQCSSTAYDEEMGRYLGRNIHGIEKYLNLPWLLTMNRAEAKGPYVNFSFLFLAILPFFFFVIRRIYKHKPLLIFTTFSSLYILIWLLSSGQGIIWYALLVFVFFLLVIELMLGAFAENRVQKVFFLILLLLSLFMSFTMRLTQWRNFKLLAYTYGKADAEMVIDSMRPDYTRIRDYLDDGRDQNPDRFYLYRIGTFITYFLNDNDQVIAFNDNQMDFIMCLYQEEDDALLASRLKELGFRYIILDLNTATIEEDVNGTLHQKFRKLLTFLNNPQHVKLVYPEVDEDTRSKYNYLNLPVKIPNMDVQNVENGVIYTFFDVKNNVNVHLNHQGHAFFELID